MVPIPCLFADVLLCTIVPLTCAVPIWADASGHAAPAWGSRGRRFKSCQPDQHFARHPSGCLVVFSHGGHLIRRATGSFTVFMPALLLIWTTQTSRALIAHEHAEADSGVVLVGDWGSAAAGVYVYASDTVQIA